MGEEAVGELSAVAWRRNRRRWLVAMCADDFFRSLERLASRE